MEPGSSWGVYKRLTRTDFEPFQKAGIEFLHAQLLYNRGVKTPEEMRTFLDARFDQVPDPFTLIEMDRAVERMLRALARREHIAIYGDFDADGVTSAALLTRALRKLKHPDAPLDFFIPHRIKDARGMSREALDKIQQEFHPSLIITTDCGSSDVEEVAYAKTLGIDIIITDHHQPPAELPQAYAMINPWRPDCAYGKRERYLCGVGVAFKLAQALLRARGRAAEVQDLLDLVAIGTIGDVAQLLGENHTLVRLGLQQLNQTKNPGLRALIQFANLQPGRIRERDISYVLAPRINAAGRMDHAGLAFKLLTTDDDEEAQAYARQLEELNQLRQQLTDELMQLVREEAGKQLDNQVVLVYGEKEKWPEGIIGLVASRLSEEIKRPVFVLSQDKDTESSRGSARSDGDFNVIEALRHRADLFERHGGHAQAAGFTIANANIKELHEHLLAWKGNMLLPVPGELAGEAAGTSGVADTGAEQEVPAATDAHKVDLVITRPEVLNYTTYTRISRLSPFGAGNPEPVFRMDGLRLYRRWPSGPEGRHLQVRLRTTNGISFNGTFFRAGSRAESFKEGARVNVIFCLEAANPPEGEGRQDVWLKILDIEEV